MKHFYTLFLLFATYLTFGQIAPNKYDYFVQFNGNQLSKKVGIDEVLNHPIITKYSSKKPDLDLRKYTSIIKLDQKITIHGNFLDSVPFYQITIPIKNKEAVIQYLIEKQGANGTNNPIQDLGKYTVFTPKGAKRSLAWNDNYLVIFELTKKLPAKPYDFTQIDVADSTAVAESLEEAVSVETKRIYGDPTKPNSSKVLEEEVIGNEIFATDSVHSDSLYDGNPYELYTLEQAEFDKKLAEKQNAIIKALFENGFTAPSFSKINEAADISTWVDYGGAFSSLYSMYNYPLAALGGYDKFLPMQKNFGNFIKGINVDFYFDNDNARIEEIVEYSDQIAGVVSKISDRKINKNIFNYFPTQKPLGYMSYHINTKAALENFPSLMTDLFQNPKFVKEDISVITDLVSTIVDEEATAKLFDGDLSAFLYGMKEVEVMTKKYDYDENFEEKIFGKMNIAQTIQAFGKNAKDSELDRMTKISTQFSDISIESAKKLIDNKLKFVFKLNSFKSDKNIILQTLDLADEMTSK